MTTQNSPLLRRSLILGLALAALVGGVAAVGLAAGGAADDSTAATADEPVFTDVRQDTLRFHEYYETIELTPEEQAVMDEALGPLPAPCCQDRSAATCCCKCNLGRSWWGLSKHLITERGYDALEVRAAVERWFEFVRPAGFSGDSCYTGRCGRSFADDGCGGMSPSNVAF